MATATPPQVGLTAEEFSLRPDPGHPEELVKGRIVAMTVPGFHHGEVCAEVAGTLRDFVKGHVLGRVLCNDSGVITERGPDTVRGADVSFYSYDRLPKGQRPAPYPAVPPNLVVEVRSPSDRWSKVLAKVTEYLAVGVDIVCVLDPDTRSAQVYESDRPVRVLGESDELTFPEVLPGFEVRVGQFFE